MKMKPCPKCEPAENSVEPSGNSGELGLCPICGGKPTAYEEEKDFVHCFHCGLIIHSRAWNTLSKQAIDARLGRMVRAMPEGSDLIRSGRGEIVLPDFTPWGVEIWGIREKGKPDHGAGKTPEEALEKAGVKA